MNPGASGTAEHEKASLARGQQIESALPPLVESAGWDSIGTLAEKSCLGDPDPAAAARETKWIGSAARDLGSEDPAQLAERIARKADELEWSHLEGKGGNGDRIFGATKDDLILSVTHQTGGGANSLSLAIHSPCLEMPAGHTLTRSTLDPMYGSSDPLYPNEDRSKFTNGEPKPLPGRTDS